MALVMPSAKEMKYCPVCHYPLDGFAEKLVDNEEITSFRVGCKNGHAFTLSTNHRRREVRLTLYLDDPRTDHLVETERIVSKGGRVPETPPSPEGEGT